MQSVERALAILDLLSRSERELGVSEISEATGLPGATVHRLLKSLSVSGYVRHNPSTRRYGLGLQLLGVAAATRERVGPLILPFLSELMELSQETANFAILEQNSVLYIEQVPPPGRLLRMFTEPGNRVPLHTAGTGKVLLAYQPRRLMDFIFDQARFPRQTPNTITDRSDLVAELAQVRRQGFATDFGEQEVGVHCLAAPVLSSDDHILAAVSLSGPSTRLSRQRLAKLVPDIKRVSSALSDAINSSSL